MPVAASLRLRAALLALATLAAPARAAEPVTHAAPATLAGPEADGAQAQAPSRAPVAAPRTYIPRVSRRLLPPAALRRHNALPADAPAPGALPGAMAEAAPAPAGGVRPYAYGAYSPLAVAPFSAARASASALGPTRTASAVAVTSRPWSGTGKLYFTHAGDHFVCSAALIGPGLLVTAAHCVAEFGQGAAGWHTDFSFAPAQFDPAQPPPFGAWGALTQTVASSYLDGSDTCLAPGVVCNNDIAVLVLAPNAAKKLPGAIAGYYGYAWNGYGFTPSFGGASLALLTQLGYPAAFDDGLMMQRNDGVAAYWETPGGAGALKNTLLGGAMTGGASGGPWLVNFGAPPVVASGASLGHDARSNLVEGVTSWIYAEVGTDTTGASWFGQNAEFPAADYKDRHGISRGAGNIGALVAAACNGNFNRCPPAP